MIACQIFAKYDFFGQSRYVESVRIKSFSGPYFPAFGLRYIYSISLRIQSKYGHLRSLDLLQLIAFLVYRAMEKTLSKMEEWKPSKEDTKTEDTKTNDEKAEENKSGEKKIDDVKSNKDEL